ncbi:hypothetical protein SAMN05444000_112118 [Shimia gijangensis]|uniref:Uncharacterized protein n=1 Tax=Shimia gijangensis TaxID=1470563 RepID=A0A1M6LVI4_9RHOB|nr:hypothetical protein SAMN05444000_112118 [Shimia gijangensis]
MSCRNPSAFAPQLYMLWSKCRHTDGYSKTQSDRSDYASIWFGECFIAVDSSPLKK